MIEYPIVIVPLSDEQGGGFVGRVPDLMGCMSDGQTQEEALENTKEAISDWLSECKRIGRSIPEPGSHAKRALEERASLLRALQTFEQHYDGLDRRIDSLTKEIKDLKEIAESYDSWVRFSEITGLGADSHEELEGHC